MDDDLKLALFIGVPILAVILFIVWALIPVKDSMDIEVISWKWSVQVYEYQALDKKATSGHIGSRWSAERQEEELRSTLVPSNAYNVTSELESGSDRRKVGEDSNGNPIYHRDYYYYWVFKYLVNEWVYLHDLDATGQDDKPHEPTRIYDEINSISDPQLGMMSCGAGHSETYYVTGTVDGEVAEFTITQADWLRLHETGIREIWFKHGRFSNDIEKVCFEKEEL